MQTQELVTESKEFDLERQRAEFIANTMDLRELKSAVRVGAFGMVVVRAAGEDFTVEGQLLLKGTKGASEEKKRKEGKQGETTLTLVTTRDRRIRMFRNIEGALLALKKLDVLKVEIDLKGWYPGKCRKRTGGRPDLAAKLKLAHRQVREQKAGGATAAENTAQVKAEVPQGKAETEDQKQRAKAMAEINEMRTMFSLLRKTMEKK